jgi:hypothetical protein
MDTAILAVQAFKISCSDLKKITVAKFPNLAKKKYKTFILTNLMMVIFKNQLHFVTLDIVMINPSVLLFEQNSVSTGT